MSKFVFVFLLFWAVASYAGDQSSCPHHAEHQKQVDEKGDRVMGFEHTKTAHHFYLKEDGGVIFAEALNSQDMESIENIRKHFVVIAASFSRGDFSMPQEIHGRVPPGVTEMTELRDQIQYNFVSTDKGGEIRITTKNENAKKAIHEFLRFQIQDHHTGDPLE